MMIFCETCRNLLEPTAVDGAFAHVCKFCNKTVPASADALVFRSVLKGSADYTSVITPYSKMDPTIPHLTHIPCQNAECKSHNKSGPLQEVIAILVDPDALKFVYQCVHCDTCWTN